MKFKIIKWLFTKNNWNMHILWGIMISIVNPLLLVIFYKTKFLTNGSVAIFVCSNLLLGSERILYLLYHLAVWILVTLGYGKYYVKSSNFYIFYIEGVRITCTIWGFIWLLLLIDISPAQQTQY